MEPHLEALAIVGGAFGLIGVATFILLLIGHHLHKKSEALRRQQER